MYDTSNPVVAKTSKRALVVADSGGGVGGSFSISRGRDLCRQCSSSNIAEERSHDHMTRVVILL